MSKPSLSHEIPPMPEAFLFDMDGLLLDTERLGLETFLEQTADHPVTPAEAEALFMTLIGTSGREPRMRVSQALSIDNIDRFWDDWYGVIHARLADGVPLRPHVPEVLADLSARGARLAVVTSTRGAFARSHLKDAGLIEHFETVIGGDEVTARKPSPAPYLEAAAHLGVAPERCAAFEDSDTGITAAMGAGCMAVQIPDLRPANTPLPDLGQRVAANLRDAIGFFGI